MLYCKVEQDGNKIPILTAGELSPIMWKDFEIASKQFFRSKNIPADQQVRQIGFQMKALAMHAWYQANTAELDAMTFDDFMQEVSMHFLEKGWQSKL